MNYLEYAKKVEQEIKAMKESRKDELLRHLLLQVAEERREEYMHLLTGNALEKDLRIDHEEFITWCQKIEDGNIHFDVQTFIDGVIVPLFLLGLYDGQRLQKAGLNMFKDTCCKLGMYSINEDWNQTLFENWKKIYRFSEEESSRYLSWVQTEVEQRVAGIVENSFRKSYGKAALLVAGIGEVMESRGEENGKRRLIEFYKKKYYRRRAFKEELDPYYEVGV